jgi:hypothetical protein
MKPSIVTRLAKLRDMLTAAEIEARSIRAASVGADEYDSINEALQSIANAASEIDDIVPFADEAERELPLDTPSLDTSFHDNEMDFS